MNDDISLIKSKYENLFLTKMIIGLLPLENLATGTRSVSSCGDLLFVFPFSSGKWKPNSHKKKTQWNAIYFLGNFDRDKHEHISGSVNQDLPFN